MALLFFLPLILSLKKMEERSACIQVLETKDRGTRIRLPDINPCKKEVALLSCGSILKNIVAMSAQKGEPVDRHKALADELRKKNGVEWREAIMADQRVEFIRGKDLARWLQAHEDKLAGVTAAGMDCITDCWTSPEPSRRFWTFDSGAVTLDEVSSE